MNAGGRAQIWVYILRLEADMRPLTKDDFVQMHKSMLSNGTRSSPPDYTHTGKSCYMHVNFILSKMIETTTSDTTLWAIDRYLAKVAWRNTEIIVRLVRRIKELNLPSPNVSDILKRTVERNPWDPLVTDEVLHCCA
ncbi:hypothetical protein EC988_000678 [Linderina pennispora]|nr:hypothetical protein EC988_000678 [Linderina pennispora]